MRKPVALTLALAASSLFRGVLAQTPTQVASTAPTPFPIDLALGIKSPSQLDRLAMSPDGRYVAYTIAGAAGPASGTTAGGGDAPVIPAPSAAPEWCRGLRLHVVDTTNGKVDWVSSESATAWAANWSPDGKTVAFYCDAGGEVGLWIHRVSESGATRLGKFVVGTSHPTRPEWMPDGEKILVPVVARAAPPNDPARESEARPQMTLAPVAPAAPRVTVRVTGDERVATPSSKAPTEESASPQPVQSLVVGPPAALVAVNVGNGSLTEILPSGDRPTFVAAKVSASGSFVACEQSLRAVFEGGLKVLLDLTLVRVADGKAVHRVEGIELDVNIDPHSPTLAAMAWHPLLDRFAYLHAGRLVLIDLTVEPSITRELPLGENAARADRLRFSPDGSRLFVSVLAPDSPAEDPFLERIVAVPTGEGSRQDLLPPAGLKLRGLIAANWRTAWQPEAGAVLVAATDTQTGESVIARLPVDGGPAAVVRRIEGSQRVVAAVENGRAVALVENASTAPDYFLLDSDLAPSQRLSVAEPRLKGVVVGPVESFATQVELRGESKTVRAVIALPPGGKRGGRFPTLVTLYPGMELSRQARSFGGGSVAMIPAAVFTTRGYAVLTLDVPLAPFGVPSDPRSDIQSVVLPQIAHAIELGYTDGARVGVMGHSYGGYGAACLACGTNTFRAVVAVSGSYDLAGTYAMQRSNEPDTDGSTLNMEYMERHQGRMGTPLWDEPQRYLDNSPYFQAHTIRAPMLLLHGRADTTCAVSEAEKMFNSRRRLGGSAELAIYEGEEHVPDEWSRENRLDMVTRTLAFFERHL